LGKKFRFSTSKALLVSFGSIVQISDETFHPYGARTDHFRRRLRQLADVNE